MLVDTHSHLYWESFKDDLDEVVKRFIDAGVTTIINVGVDLELSQKALDQVENELSKYKELNYYSTIGIHPHEAVNYYSHKSQVTSDKLEKDIKKLEDIYKSNPEKVVGVGECGLDYFFRNKDSHVADAPRNDNAVEKELQRKLFKAQIELAKKLNIPLIVHCRDDRSKDSGSTGSPPTETVSPSAWDDVLEMIGDHPTILHCYSGLPETTKQALKKPDVLFSFAATITYPKNEYLREAAKLIPLERIVLETDCPFLPPQSKRGERNEPVAVVEIAKLIADLRGISFEEVASQTTENAKKIFGLNY